MSQRTANASTSPVFVFKPVGRSKARSMGLLAAALTLAKKIMVCLMMPSSGRDWPVPSMESITRADLANMRSSVPGVALSMTWTPYSSAQSILGSASGRPSTVKQVTSAPQRRRCRAATRPSAPLFPGPTKMRIRTPAAPTSSRAPCATAKPAFSIRVSVLTPALSDACSMAVICAAVTIFM